MLIWASCMIDCMIGSMLVELPRYLQTMLDTNAKSCLTSFSSIPPSPYFMSRPKDARDPRHCRQPSRACRTVFVATGPREGKADDDGRGREEGVCPPQVASPGSVLGRFLTGSRRRRVVRLFSSLQVIILLVTRHPLPTECREPCSLARGCMRHPINRESMAQNHSDQVRGLEIC